MGAQRQRNPTSDRPLRRLAFGIEQLLEDASRSPTRSLSPIRQTSRGRRRSHSNTSIADELARLCSEGLDRDLRDHARAQSIRSGSAFPGRLSLPGLDMDTSMLDVFGDATPNEAMSGSPQLQESPASAFAPDVSLPSQTLQRRKAPARVKDGEMIRITVKTRTTQVPCIVKCCPRRPTSMADDDFARAWNVDVHPFPKERWRDAKHWCILDVIDVEKAGNTKTRLKMPLNKFQDRRYNIELGLDALTSLGLVEDDTEPSLPRPTPASQGPSVDLNAASFHLDVWGQCVAPTSPALEERNPQRNLSLAIPEIKIDPSPLCLPSPSYGSTSAEDDGSNWDMYSMVSQSFQDDERIWSPSVSEC